MKTTAKTALGGMIAALSVALMLLSAVIPFMSYALPAIAGALMMIIVMECDKKWALAVYISVSIISLMVVPDKSAGFAYALFFGYYPIIKAILESKCKRKIEKFLKLLIFNVITLSSYYVLLLFVGIDTSGIEFLEPYLRKWFVAPIIIIIGSIFFIMYDIVLTRLIIIYCVRYRNKFRKLFK